jgi:hypothetical protein
MGPRKKKQPAPKEWSWYKNIYEKVRNVKLRKRLEQEEQSPKPAASRRNNHAIQQGPHRE